MTVGPISPEDYAILYPAQTASGDAADAYHWLATEDEFVLLAEDGKVILS